MQAHSVAQESDELLLQH